MIQTSDNIAEKLNKLPELPGIYKFIDSSERIIYIGKSICLRKRVKSYFVDNPKWEKVKKMLPFIDDIEYTVTDTHLEAKLLECELIKSIKPIFNTQMKNDESYAYIKVEEYNSYNPISIIYKREENSFGPFRKKFSLLKTIGSLKNIYPITKNEGKYKFDYNLMPLTMDILTFEENKYNLIDIFSNDNSMMLFIQEIEHKMKEAASLYKFETASTYRDIIFNLNYLKSGLNGYRNLFAKNIILKIPTTTGNKLFFVSKGQILLQKNYKNLNNKSIDIFTHRGMKLINSPKLCSKEKLSIDYRDILYSEIQGAPWTVVFELDHF